MPKVESVEGVFHAITLLLASENSEVSYSRLSEELSIPVDMSKRLLASYVNLTTPTPGCSFLLELRPRNKQTEFAAAEYRSIKGMEYLKSAVSKIKESEDFDIMSISVSSVWANRPLDSCALWKTETQFALSQMQQDDSKQTDEFKGWIPFYVTTHLSCDRHVPRRCVQSSPSTCVPKSVTIKENRTTIKAESVFPKSSDMVSGSEPLNIPLTTTSPLKSNTLSNTKRDCINSAKVKISSIDNKQSSIFSSSEKTDQKNTSHVPVKPEVGHVQQPSVCLIEAELNLCKRSKRRREMNDSDEDNHCELKDRPSYSVPDVSESIKEDSNNYESITQSHQTQYTKKKRTGTHNNSIDVPLKKLTTAITSVPLSESAALFSSELSEDEDTLEKMKEKEISSPNVVKNDHLSCPHTIITKIKVPQDKKFKKGKYTVVDSIDEIKEIVSTSQACVTSNFGQSKTISRAKSLKTLPNKTQGNLLTFFSKKPNNSSNQL